MAIWTPAGRHRDTSLKEAQVERFTATGRIVVDGRMYLPDGYAPESQGHIYLGPSSKGLTHADIKEWDIEHIEPHWREDGTLDLAVVPRNGRAVMFRNCRIARN